jgi:hypothetical protein
VRGRCVQGAVASPIFQADVGAFGADRVGGDGQALQDLVGVGPQQQPVFEGGGFPFGGVAHHHRGRLRPPGPPATSHRWGLCPAAAAQPASCYLPDDRDGPGDEGLLEPAASSGGLIFAEGSPHQVRRGAGGSLPLATPFPERPEQPLRLAGYRPAQPGRPPTCRGRQLRWCTRTAQRVIDHDREAPPPSRSSTTCSGSLSSCWQLSGISPSGWCRRPPRRPMRPSPRGSRGPGTRPPVGDQ